MIVLAQDTKAPGKMIVLAQDTKAPGKLIVLAQDTKAPGKWIVLAQDTETQKHKERSVCKIAGGGKIKDKEEDRTA